MALPLILKAAIVISAPILIGLAAGAALDAVIRARKKGQCYGLEA